MPAYIVEAARTAGGKKNGSLSGHHPIALGSQLLDGLVKKALGSDLSKAAFIDDVIFGCLSVVGPQSGNIARMSVLNSETIPHTTPGVTLDRQCGSSQQAIHFAAQAVMSGTQDVVIAGGVENMSVCAIGASVIDGMARGLPMTETLQAKFNAKGPVEKTGVGGLDEYQAYGLDPAMFSQFGGAELLAKKHGFSRADLDRFSARSQERAAAATKAGKFRDEILPMAIKYSDKAAKSLEKKGQAVPMGELVVDEVMRPHATFAALQKMDGLHGDNGVLTAGSASGICDGASGVLICNEAGLAKLGVRPKAVIRGMAVSGGDPVIMLEGPIRASQMVLERTGLTICQFDRYEVNEAFAPVPMAWAKVLRADENKLNVNGGAIALGHPIGATGTKLMTTLLYELIACGGKLGLLAICEGGGTANATVIERCDGPVSPVSRL